MTTLLIMGLPASFVAERISDIPAEIPHMNAVHAANLMRIMGITNKLMSIARTCPLVVSSTGGRRFGIVSLIDCPLARTMMPAMLAASISRMPDHDAPKASRWIMPTPPSPQERHL
eukprot:CAMPEP_0197639978 /NCGR_PEP_ID=MMETSP1338-20131121/14430_1 /TAXON_ID=43686 ORGANISM="Pelagodinium beii, Strain RCC1491" /NCGR_SAMPLE_ID=MMETSP1338 /ASSEMBLY_ACC=CAM_ASM_000754 /LENGTH=115 /DNA_ID=CAMNT_0043212779 /DNA_START=183 /DNA_END=530 /DNA_ORIENTATION=+